MTSDAVCGYCGDPIGDYEHEEYLGVTYHSDGCAGWGQDLETFLRDVCTDQWPAAREGLWRATRHVPRNGPGCLTVALGLDSDLPWWFAASDAEIDDEDEVLLGVVVLQDPATTADEMDDRFVRELVAAVPRVHDHHHLPDIEAVARSLIPAFVPPPPAVVGGHDPDVSDA